MINQQLLDYIKQQIQQSISREQIKNSLLASGWAISDIEEAFNSLTFPNQPIVLNSSSSQSFSSQPSKKLNKTLLAVIFMIAGVLITGGGVFAYFNYFQSPEKIINKMIVKLVEIKSAEYSGEIKTEINTENFLGAGSNFSQSTQPIPNQQTGSFSINFSGVSDTHDLNNPKGSFSSSFNVKTSALNGLGQENFSFGLETRTIDKIIYIKLVNVPNLEFFDLSTAANQWIKIDIEALKKQFGLEKLEEQIKETQEKQGLSSEQIEKLKTAVQQAKIFKITEKLPSEKIEGINTYHYKFIIDAKEVENLSKEIGKIIQNETSTEGGRSDFDKKFGSVKLTEAVELPEGEIWIGKNDLLPYKISLSSIIKKTDTSAVSGKINFMLSFKNFNKPVQIEIPTPVKTLEEVLSVLFSGQMQKTQPGIKLPTR